MIPNKIHLSKLPDLTEDHIPPRPNSVSKRGLVLLPLFTNPDVITSHAAISACWAHRSWLLYSDAIDYGIEIKFYIDERVRESAMPILERNFISENDIIFHDNARQFDVPYQTTGIEKAASYTDDRFAEYDWIFDVDTDIFVMSPNREKLPFFRCFFEICDTEKIGVSWRSSEYLTPLDLHWSGGIPEEEVKDWKLRFLELAGEKLVGIYFDSQQAIIVPNGGIVAIPAKEFQRHRRHDLEFIMRASRDLRDLEAGLSVWDALISKVWGDSLFDIFPAIKTTNFDNDADIGSLEHFLNTHSEGNPFLLHYSKSRVAYYWYQGIGVFDG